MTDIFIKHTQSYVYGTGSHLINVINLAV